MRSDSDSQLAFENDEKGNAILEFAIVLPLIFALFLATVEFTRIFRVKEMMSLATREAAHLAFRECFDSQGSLCNIGGDDINKIDACLDYFAGQVKASIDTRLPDITLTLSIYAFDTPDPLDPTLGTIQRVGITTEPTNPPSYGQGTETKSKFTPARVTAQYRDIIKKQQLLVFAEIYYNFPFIFRDEQKPKPTAESIVSTNWFAGSSIQFNPSIEMYDVTVF